MFSKSKFCSEIEVKFAVPKAYGGGLIVLALSIATNAEYENVRQAFLALPEAERTGGRVLEVIRRFVCSLLLREPVGIEDFPKKDFQGGNSLLSRALDYFTDNEPELQDFFDEILLTAWTMHKELSEPDTFPRPVSDSGAREPGSGAVTA
jgi:hypothetical protein